MIIKKTKGFTLIELIIVVAIIGLLAAALYVAIDPAKRIGQANDAKRWADVTAILNAMLTYITDVSNIPTSIAGMTADSYYVVGNGATDGTTIGCSELNDAGSTTEVDYTTRGLYGNLVDRYLATIPMDPQHTTSTGYYVKRSTNNRITVGSCIKQQATTSIEVQR